jgi:hypothetical protein
MRGLLGALAGTVALESSGSRGNGESGEAEDLPIEGLKIDDQGVMEDDKAESGDTTRCLGLVMRILHACLANEQSRKYFEVSCGRVGKGGY